MSLRPSDISMALSGDAAELLLAAAGGYCWRAKLTGSPFELMQFRLVDAKHAMAGRGYVLTPTPLGREVVAELNKVGGLQS